MNDAPVAGARRVLRRAAATAALALAPAVAVSCGGGGGRASTTTQPPPRPATLRVGGSTTLGPVATDAAGALGREGLKVSVDTAGGSEGGLLRLATHQVEVAMATRPVGEDDRRRFASVTFASTPVGHTAVGVVVRREVFDGGVRSLSRDQLKALFEGRVHDWSELGGPGLPVFVIHREAGADDRKELHSFLYGEDNAAPPPPTSPAHPVVASADEARTRLASTPGAVAPLAIARVLGEAALVPVAVDGVGPTPASLRVRAYPLGRPLLLITNGPPAGSAKRFVDYLVSDQGQSLVRRHGYLTLADLGVAGGG